MGVYKAAVVTESGQNLIAQAFTSEKKLIFTSAKTSSYSYPAGTNISVIISTGRSYPIKIMHLFFLEVYM